MVKLAFPPWCIVIARHVRDTLEELIYLAVFGLMPVWLGGLIGLVLGKGFLSHLGGYLYSGEALLICTASVGPLIYLILKEYSKDTSRFSRAFPGRNIFVPLICIVCLTSAGIVGSRSVINESNLSIDILWTVSFVATVISLVIWVSVTTVKNALDFAAPNIMRQDTEDFVTEWQK
jgi:hypothetical protein